MRSRFDSLIRHALVRLAPLVALIPLASPEVSACRYSVRDTGFVDLEQAPWVLRLSGVPVEVRELWEQASRRRLLDTNLRLAPEGDGDAEARRGSPSESLPVPVLDVLGPDGRALVLATGGECPNRPDDIADFLERLAASPMRDTLHDALLSAFAVLFVIEGADPSRNAEVRRTAEDAIRAFTPLLGSLPKPVETPPVAVVLPVAQFASERLLVWSVGFASEPTAEPRLAVLFGRGRRLGPPLEGRLVTRTALVDRLTVIGQDCECDLDRSLLQGPVFAGRWDLTRQTTAARRLGFDPENPMVRTEVSRIVLRGPLPGQARRSGPSTFDALALGYREDAVDVLEIEPAVESIAAGNRISDGDADRLISTAAAHASRLPSPGGPRPDPPDAPAGLRLALFSWLILGGTPLAVLALGIYWWSRAAQRDE